MEPSIVLSLGYCGPLLHTGDSNTSLTFWLYIKLLTSP